MILKIVLGVFVAVLVAGLFIIGQFFHCARRNVAVGKGAIAGTLVSPWFIATEIIALFLVAHHR